MVPEGTNSAASFPSNWAAISWRRLTQGSSPKTSSPTSAAAIAWRMPGEGLVTVSLRRSMTVLMLDLASQGTHHQVVARDEGVVTTVAEQGIDLVAVPADELAARLRVVVGH